MTTGEYGVITDMYALIPFAMVVLTMGMETGYFRLRRQSGRIARAAGGLFDDLGAVSAVAVLFAALGILFTPELSRVMDYPDHPSYIWIVAVVIALDVITAIPYAAVAAGEQS